MANVYRRLLSREAGNYHADDEENLGFFYQFWRMVQRIIISFLNRLPCGTDGEDAIASVEEKVDSSRSYIADEISLVPEFGHLQVKQRTGGIVEILSEITIGEVAIPSVEERDDNSRNYITDEISPVSEFRHPNAEKQACGEILFERTFAEVVIASVEEKACRSASYITDRISPVLEKRLKNTNLGCLGHYSWDQTILLVGEGDFSFSASLAVAFGDASNMIATSLNHIEFLQKNYKRAEMNIMELKSRGCKVMHGVDATKMANSRRLQFTKFDCIVYNFPHAGFTNRQATRDAEISKHQDLVRGFMANAKTMIKPEGQIHIAHKCIGFFREWNLKELGTNEGLRLVEESPFKLKDYPGYSTKYGYGGDGDFNCKPSKTYKFQLATSSKKKPSKTLSMLHVEFGHLQVKQRTGGIKACRSASYITERISPVLEKQLKNTNLGCLGHYSWDQTILLVGEGDFSFSASLAVAFGDASNMIATSLNHIEFLQKNYKRAKMNIMELKSRGCKVMHGVDATKMGNSRRLRFTKFDCIVYNFPHAGFTNRQATRDDEISKHQDLVRGFMANAKTMIKPEGQIHIANNIGFFREWNLKELGTSEGLRLVEESPFKLKDYPGYSTKYGYGGDADFDCKPSKTYKFQLATSSKKKKGRKQKK